MKVFFLDDDEKRHEAMADHARLHKYEFEPAWDAAGAMELLTKNSYSVIMLDHDLGGEVYVDSSHKNTGAEVARFLANFPNDRHIDTPVICHSWNPPGCRYMAMTLRDRQRGIIHMLPFGSEAMLAAMRMHRERTDERIRPRSSVG